MPEGTAVSERLRVSKGPLPPSVSRLQGTTLTGVTSPATPTHSTARGSREGRSQNGLGPHSQGKQTKRPVTMYQ